MSKAKHHKNVTNSKETMQLLKMQRNPEDMKNHE